MAKLEYTLSLPDANYILHEMSLTLIYGNVDFQHDYSSITIFVFIKSQSVIVISVESTMECKGNKEHNLVYLVCQSFLFAQSDYVSYRQQKLYLL